MFQVILNSAIAALSPILTIVVPAIIIGILACVVDWKKWWNKHVDTDCTYGEECFRCNRGNCSECLVPLRELNPDYYKEVIFYE